MKRILLFTIATVCIQLYSCTTTVHVVNSEPAVPAPPPAGASFQVFYDELGPYGHWINNPGYGYVWMPNVDPGFRPYATNGHWVYSDAGWTWVSDYPWGWATFHYGRWFYEDGYGWMWVPGHEWAPAWVSWRRGTNVYGWAPLSPGISVSVSYSNYDPPANYWCFVPRQYVASPHVNNYYTAPVNNVTIIKNTTIINNNTTVNNYGSGNTTNINSNNNNNSNNRNNNNTINSNNGNNSNSTSNSNNNNSNNHNNRAVFMAGPDKNEVEQVTNTHIQAVAILDGNRPGATQTGNGQLVVYRPKIAPATGNIQNKPAPAKIEMLKEIKPTATANNKQPEASSAPAINNVNAMPVKKEQVPVQTQTVQPSANVPAIKTEPAVNNVNAMPVKKDLVPFQTQTVQPSANVPAIKTVPVKPLNKTAPILTTAPEKIEQPVINKRPDDIVNNPVPAVTTAPVKNLPLNNKNIQPVNSPVKTAVSNGRPAVIRPAGNQAGNTVNQQKMPVFNPAGKMVKPQAPAKITDSTKNKKDGKEKKND